MKPASKNTKPPSDSLLSDVTQRYRYPLTSHTGGFIVVDVDSFQLKIRVAMVGASRVNTMLVRDHLPELHAQQTTHHHHFITPFSITLLPCSLQSTAMMLNPRGQAGLEAKILTSASKTRPRLRAFVLGMSSNFLFWPRENECNDGRNWYCDVIIVSLQWLSSLPKSSTYLPCVIDKNSFKFTFIVVFNYLRGLWGIHRLSIDSENCHRPRLKVFLADHTNGRAIGTLLRPSVCLSVVCDVMYYG